MKGVSGGVKVIKFGGSWSAFSGEQLKKVFNIVMEDSEPKDAHVSVPGKRNPDDIKVTDLLISCAERQLNGENGEELFRKKSLDVMLVLLKN